MKVRHFVCAAVALAGLLCGGLLSAAEAGPAVVKVTGGPGTFQLTVDGKPYFACGVGGSMSLETLKACGGNSFRTWGIDHAARDLAKAEAMGLTVTLGYWMGHERHGFDYSDTAALEKQKAEVRQMVEKYKNHPALLIWGLGNEMELEAKNPEPAWRQVNVLAELIHELDPNHPVMTVVAEVTPEKLAKLQELCPAVDIIGVNAYGGAASIGDRWVQMKAKKPFMLTEFGPVGHWETGKVHGAAVEANSSEKAAVYADAYKKTVAAQRGKYCLGSYAFLWGHKMEGTPTWFGMLLEDGSKLAAAQAMQEAWAGKPLPAGVNRVPEIKPLAVAKTEGIREGEEIAAKAEARDPDGDALKYQWTLIAEVGYSVGGDAQNDAPEFPEAITAGQGTASVKVKLPGGGVYRLYAYVRDGHGNAAYASQILQGEGDKPDFTLPAVKLPCVVYADDVPVRWIPSGYMGQPQAISMDSGWEKKPHSGATCMKVTFRAKEGWGGVLWQSPANDWGDKPGGFNLTGAGTLEFWARGEDGGEIVTFQVGGLENKAFSDSMKTQKREVTLTKNWTRYRITLDGLDLTCVKTGFGWVTVSRGQPTVFYLDDIRFTEE